MEALRMILTAFLILGVFHFMPVVALVCIIIIEKIKG
jgi:hypothetical protein